MNSPLLVVLPFCEKDEKLAYDLLDYIAEIHIPKGERMSHSILLVADSKVKRETLLSMRDKALRVFRFSEGIFAPVPDDRQHWPKGPNFMFHLASQVVQVRYRLPFLWLEPDCVPLVHNWLDRLAWEYHLCPKQFMGTMATAALTPDLPVRHLSGVAVYPPNAHTIMKEACASDIAFDYASAEKVVNRLRAWETKLIFEIWGDHAKVPTFKRVKSPGDPDTVVVRAAIPQEAVLYHRCKDGTLIDILRRPSESEDYGLPNPPEAPKPEPTPQATTETLLPETTTEAVDDMEVIAKLAEEAVVESEQKAASGPQRQYKKTRIGLPADKMAVI